MKNQPTGVIADRNTNQLTVTWKDGHTSVYSFSLLRFACPCAECRGGHDKMGGDPPPEVFSMPAEDTQRTHLVNIEGVGTYAVSPHWEDGHSAGIYNWNYLRALCPCSKCRNT